MLSSPGRTMVLEASRLAASPLRDKSPISARFARCCATVLPLKAPGLPAGRALAFRAKRTAPQPPPNIAELPALFSLKVQEPSGPTWGFKEAVPSSSRYPSTLLSVEGLPQATAGPQHYGLVP